MIYIRTFLSILTSNFRFIFLLFILPIRLSRCHVFGAGLNNLVAPSRSLGTISNGIHPIIVQFPAYRPTSRIFRDILTTDMNNELVTGDTLKEMNDSLKDKLTNAFWNTVIQFVADTTRDVTDFIRVGRALWPVYILPLHSTTIQTTMQKVAAILGVSPVSAVIYHPKMEEELVTFIGAQFYPKISAASRSANNGLALMALNEYGILMVGEGITSNTVSQGSSSNNHSFLRQCLILASFICQSNKANQDKKMFSVQANGKRQKRQAKVDIYGAIDEDIAYGEATSSGSRAEQLTSLRLRSFPLERVFSIFISLVQLNPTKVTLSGITGGYNDKPSDEWLLSLMGYQRLHNDIAHFIDEGKLHPTNYTGFVRNEQTNLSSARFWCSLTRDEATSIAQSINVPLEKYLL